MKKLLLLLLIPCLLLCSCNIAGSDNGQTNEQTTTEETTEEVTTEEPIQLNFPTINTIEEYNYLLETIRIHDSFITLEELLEMGDFVHFKVYEKNKQVNSFSETDFEDYEYRFAIQDPEPGKYYDDYGDSVYGFRLRISEYEGEWEPASTLTPAFSTDMTLYGGEEKTASGSVWIGDIRYSYSNGILQQITWVMDNHIFTVYSAYETHWFHRFSVFEPEKMEDGFLRDLLNAETAEAAIERFAAKLRGEEDTP